MGIKKVVQIENTDVHILDKVTFDSQKKDYYEKIFNDYKNQGIIAVDCEFNDQIWKFDDGMDEYPVEFSFNELNFNKEKRARELSIDYDGFVLSLKSFVLMICGEVSLSNIKKIFRILRKITDTSDFFNSEKLISLYEITKDASSLFRYEYIIKYLEFSECFVEHDLYTEAFEDIVRSKQTVVNKRKLGSYETMFKLNDIVNVFFNEATKEEKIKYYPVLLWWKITTIIPMRSTEFTVIPKECCAIRNGRYYLSVYRTTQKAMKDDVLLKSYLVDDKYELQELEVTEDIYNTIKEYKDLVDELDDIPNFYGEYQDKLTYPEEKRKFLLSARSSWSELNKTGKHFRCCRPHHEYYDSDMVARLINNFFDKVVSEKYGFEVIEKTDVTTRISGKTIEKVQMMDTRHFAFANMALQGVSPLVMKYMGGHKEIESSYHYYSHLPNFIKSYTYSLAKKISFDKFKRNGELNNQKQDYSHILQLNYSEIDKRSLHLKTLFGDTAEKPHKTIGGFKCYSLSFPMDCISVDNNCSICEFGSPCKEHLDDISKELDSINNNIATTVEAIYNAVKNFNSNLDAEENIKTLSNKVKILIKNKADLISNHLI